MATSPKVHFYGAIEKFDSLDDGSLIVSGIASTESVDADGEIVTADAMRKAIPEYLQKGTVREMHQPIAAGTPLSAHVDAEGKTHFTAKIVDKDTINKIKTGVLKGFSIGGKMVKKVGNKITELILRDISVVDIPNNPQSYFTVIKFDKPGDKCTDPECKNHHEEAVEKCGICKSKEKHEHNMNEEAMKKLDTLAATVETLAKTVETLSKIAPPDLKKFEDAIGDLQKKADEAAIRAVESEKNSIVSKMQSEGRVAIKDDGAAYKSEELLKMDLNLLKFAARNAQQLPIVAKATYSGTGTGPDESALNGKDGKPLTGDALVEAGFAKAGYTDLNKMISNATK